MEQQIQNFNFESKNVRIIMRNNEPWWVAKDVCDVLGLTNVTQALEKLEKDDICQNDLTDSVGRTQVTKIINEGGLWTLVLRSDKQEAKTFKRWLTHEVIPSIRKTGSYNMPQTYLEALEAYTKTVKALEDEKALVMHKQSQIDALNPLVKVYKDLYETEDLYTLGKAAKVICNTLDEDFGRTKLSQWLQENGYMCKDLTPYQQYIKQGLMKVKAVVWKKDGVIHEREQTFVTAKGVKKFSSLMNNVVTLPVEPKKVEIGEVSVDLTNLFDDDFIDKINSNNK